MSAFTLRGASATLRGRLHPSAASMYRCEQCNEVVGPRIPMERVVVETRPVTYPFREEVNRARHRRTGRVIWVDDEGGEGRETVRELAVCARCAAAR